MCSRFKLTSDFEGLTAVWESLYFPCCCYGAYLVFRWEWNLIPSSVSLWGEIPKSGHLIPLSDPCLSLLCLSLPSSASLSFVSLTCGFSARARAWKSWHSHIPQIEAQRGTLPPGAGSRVQSDWYSKTLRARRHISGRCKMSWRFWEQALRSEKSTPSDLLLLISFMWVVSVWDPNWRWEDWASCSLLKPTPLFTSEAIGVKPPGPCLDSVPGSGNNPELSSSTWSLLWCVKRKRLWAFPGDFDVLCCWSWGLCARRGCWLPYRVFHV